MDKTKLTLEQITDLHKRGELAAAKAGYLQYLSEDPDNANLHNQLALLYVEEGELDHAQDELERAIKLNPQEPSYHLHLANIFKAKGLFSQAALVLNQLITQHPDYAAAYNNLGTIYYAQAKLAEAAKAYQNAIDYAPHYMDAYYNLGLALTKLNQREAAMNTYRALIELVPNHVGAHFQLGCLLMDSAKYPAAIEQFSAIERDHPFHFETESNIATCYLRLGQLNEAKMYYLKALALMPNDSQILFNLGVISVQQGLPKEAVEYYLQVLKNDPDHLAAHNNIAIIYLGLQDKPAALNHFREALRITPENAALKHIVNMMMQAKHISSAPPEYIESLFNAYADHYDAHLTESLNYAVPQMLYQLINDTYVKAHQTPLPSKQLDILDLGCGTGLSGLQLRVHARNLTGVDLSEHMLFIAQQKGIYDKLIKADVLKFLHASSEQQYDLVVAADVIVYMGELTELFAAIRGALKSGGLFAFNIEVLEEVLDSNHSDQEPYRLTESGRFVHSKAYIEACAGQAQLEIMQAKFGFMRKQAEHDVNGMYYVLAG